jgi:integrase
MPRIYLRNKTWWCWGLDAKGKRWRRSTKQRDKRAAERAARRIEIELADQTHESRSLALSKAVECLIEHLDQQQRSKTTLQIYRQKAGHLVRILGARRDVSKMIEADTLEYWRVRSRERVDAEDPGPSAHTVQKELRVLVQAVRYCERAGLCTPVTQPGNLMPKELAQSRVYQPRERWLPRDTEYEALKGAMNTARRDYLVAFCFTGLRLGELYKIHAYHIDLVARELDADGTKTRRSKRIIPLSDEAFEVLARRAKERPTGPLFEEWGKLHRDMRAACKRAGIDPVSPNDLRRTFASWLAQAGVPMLTTARLLGHSSTKMVEQVYAQLSRDVLRDAVATLDRKPEEPSNVVPFRRSQA